MLSPTAVTRRTAPSFRCHTASASACGCRRFGSRKRRGSRRPVAGSHTTRFRGPPSARTAARRGVPSGALQVPRAGAYPEWPSSATSGSPTRRPVAGSHIRTTSSLIEWMNPAYPSPVTRRGPASASSHTASTVHSSTASVSSGPTGSPVTGSHTRTPPAASRSGSVGPGLAESGLTGPETIGLEFSGPELTGPETAMRSRPERVR